MADFNSDNAIIDEVLTNLQNNNSNSNEKPIVPQANLLINGDFRIWQRGTSFIAPNNQYTADRWRANGSGTVTSDNGYKVVGTVSITYTMEDLDFDKINGKIVTLSYQFSGEDIVTSTFTATSAVICTLEITDKTLLWVKLELGEVATDNITRLYAEELALCQRYYENNYRYGNGRAVAIEYASGVVLVSLQLFKERKRIEPSCKVYPRSPLSTNNYTMGVRNISSSTFMYDDNATFTNSVDGISSIYFSGVTANKWYDFVWEADAEIY